MEANTAKRLMFLCPWLSDAIHLVRKFHVRFSFFFFPSLWHKCHNFYDDLILCICCLFASCEHLHDKFSRQISFSTKRQDEILILLASYVSVTGLKLGEKRLNFNNHEKITFLCGNKNRWKIDYSSLAFYKFI